MTPLATIVQRELTDKLVRTFCNGNRTAFAEQLYDLFGECSRQSVLHRLSGNSQFLIERFIEIRDRRKSLEKNPVFTVKSELSLAGNPQPALQQVQKAAFAFFCRFPRPKEQAYTMELYGDHLPQLRIDIDRQCKEETRLITLLYQIFGPSSENSITICVEDIRSLKVLLCRRTPFTKEAVSWECLLFNYVKDHRKIHDRLTQFYTAILDKVPLLNTVDSSIPSTFSFPLDDAIPRSGSFQLYVIDQSINELFEELKIPVPPPDSPFYRRLCTLLLDEELRQKILSLFGPLAPFRKWMGLAPVYAIIPKLFWTLFPTFKEEAKLGVLTPYISDRCGSFFVDLSIGDVTTRSFILHPDTLVTYNYVLDGTPTPNEEIMTHFFTKTSPSFYGVVTHAAKGIVYHNGTLLPSTDGVPDPTLFGNEMAHETSLSKLAKTPGKQTISVNIHGAPDPISTTIQRTGSHISFRSDEELYPATVSITYPDRMKAKEMAKLLKWHVLLFKSALYKSLEE